MTAPRCSLHRRRPHQRLARILQLSPTGRNVLDRPEVVRWLPTSNQAREFYQSQRYRAHEAAVREFGKLGWSRS